MAVPKNLQEYLDLLLRVNSEGGFPSIDPGERRCCYRSPEGRACAVGLLISDRKYRKSMEGAVLYCAPDVIAALPKWAQGLDLNSVQQVHDSLAFDHTEDRYSWDKRAFRKRLLALPLFQGLRPTPLRSRA